VRTPLNQLSDVLAARAIETRRNVLGSEIEVSGYFVLAYQIVGQGWSIMVPDELIEPYRIAPASVPSAVKLSKQLEQPVIRLVVSDTCGVIGYDFFEDGEIVEYFAGSEDESVDGSNEYGLSPERYILTPYPDYEPEAKQVAYFWSHHRKVTAQEISSIWSFVEQFIFECDAYDPAISATYLLGESWLKRGGHYRVQNPGFTLALGSGQRTKSVPELVRVDYFRFGN
jgi:hypothetical protein